jgi:hypothetical protein
MLRSVAVFLWLASGFASAQPAVEKRNGDALDALRAEIQELRNSLQQVKDELADSRRESAELRRDLNSLRGQGDIQQRVAAVEEQQAMTNNKVDAQYQSTVASASKYRVRLSGMALFNAETVRGSVNDLDVPTKVEGDSRGSLGASLRQSQIGIEVFGPAIAGARTSGEVRLDFAGGFPASEDGLTAGLVRLRTARLALDWKHTTIAAGQETPLFSPLSPTSLVAAAYPSMSNAGNLWVWTPQVYVERRFQLSDRTQFSWRGGVLDPLTGEAPASEYERMPTAGERSRTPAYATRAAWQRAYGDRNAAIGVGGYFARQDWEYHRRVRSWAAAGDWEAPLGRWFSWSGEVYHGVALGGLGGGPNASVLFTGDPQQASSAALPVASSGGWSQLKFQPVSKWQFNAVFGQDFASGGRLRLAADSYVRRNAASMFNFICQARSNLLVSAEYRHLRTRPSIGPPVTADHISLGMGILF